MLDLPCELYFGVTVTGTGVEVDGGLLVEDTFDGFEQFGLLVGGESLETGFEDLCGHHAHDYQALVGLVVGEPV